ncbi:porin family protein [Niveibacterium sp. SC-1]|uniref:porin family protein n=1 Tax=Niveibacterium sp. SC-1 TaxID=3135646 RepID=UPI00311E08B0
MKRTLIATAAVASLFAGSAMAADTGFYAGGNLGTSKQDISASAPRENSPTTGGIYGGYNFNRNVGVEVSYNNHGKSSVEGLNDVKTRSLDVDLVARMPVHENVDIYGKAGVAYLDRELEQAGASTSRNGAAGKLGIGAEFKATEKVALRVEVAHYMGAPTFEGPGYEYKDNFTTFTVGANYKF